MGIEKRRESRNPCYLRASIFVETTNTRFDAEVTDISNAGLCIRVSDTRAIPDYFMVSIPRRHFLERVRVMRRGKQDLGCVVQVRGR